MVAAVASEGWIGPEPPVDVEERAARILGVIERGEPEGVWVVEQDGAIVGFATATLRVRGVLWLAMALLPEARGRGTGRALLEAVLAHGRAKPEAHKLELEAWVENGRAIALYSSAGFEVEGVRRETYLRRDGRRRSSVMMACRLD